MGIRGLTTYIDSHSDHYLEQCKLRNTHIVIDGNSIAACLYNWHSNCNSAFGGEYDKYAACVANFFVLLKKCNVTPIVLFDGGYERKKLKTVLERLRNKVMTFRSIDPCSMLHRNAFPLLMKDVFKDVINEMDVLLIQCLFEADADIAAVARHLGCPVLSYDSDFYMLDVSYIPFNTLELKSVVDDDNSCYIDCRVYHVQTFIDSFGELDKCMLPLMATLLGNDYISRSTFKNFFSQIKIPKNKSMSETQRKISGVLDWLRHETWQSAMEKILLCVKKDRRPMLTEKMKTSIMCYKHSSKVLPLLHSRLSTEVPQTSLLNHTSSSDIPDIDFSEGSECEAGVSYENEDFMNMLPSWFKNEYYFGKLPPCFIDMLHLKSYFLSSQVEDFSQRHSHELSMPFISVIFEILKTACEGTQTLEVVSRNSKSGIQRFNTVPINESVHKVLPKVESISSLPVKDRQHIMFCCLEFNSLDRTKLKEFPDDWKVFIASLVYWLRHASIRHIGSVLNAVLLAAVVLKVVNRYTKYCKSKKYILNAVKKELSSSSRKEEDNEQPKTIDEESKCEESNPLCEENVSSTDCFLLVEQFLRFSEVDTNLKQNKNLYCIDVLHSFAQLQSCVQHVMYLNALLQFPFEHCCIAKFFSGTIVYNFYILFKKHSNSSSYISNMLRESKTVKKFYFQLLHLVEKFLPEQGFFESCQKQHKKKKKKKKSENKSLIIKNTDNDHLSNDETDYFEDVNNRFSQLQMCANAE